MKRNPPIADADNTPTIVHAMVPHTPPLIVEVGVAVGGGKGTGVGVGVGVAVRGGMGTGGGVGVEVDVAVREGMDVGTGDGVGDGMGVAVSGGMGMGTGVGVGVGKGVGVGTSSSSSLGASCVGTGVGVGEGVSTGVEVGTSSSSSSSSWGASCVSPRVALEFLTKVVSLCEVEAAVALEFLTKVVSPCEEEAAVALDLRGRPSPKEWPRVELEVVSKNFSRHRMYTAPLFVRPSSSNCAPTAMSSIPSLLMSPIPATERPNSSLLSRVAVNPPAVSDIFWELLVVPFAFMKSM